MTRIYFKPQSCSVRNPRTRKHIPPVIKSAAQHIIKDDASQTGWRSKLDPDAIEQIADGLEKMVLSWTTQPIKEDGQEGGGGNIAGQQSQAPVSEMLGEIARDEQGMFINSTTSFPQSADGNFLVTAPSSRAISAMAPAIEEMMRGELIKSCRPPITNGEPVTDSIADSSYWYLTPAKSLPNSCRNTNDTNLQQSADRALYGPIASLELSANNGNGFELVHQDNGSKSNNGDGRTKQRKKGTRIQSVEEESDSDAKDADGQKNAPPEKISYHIQSNNWTETIEINGGNRITDLLGKKLTLGNPNTYPPLLQDVKDDRTEVHKKQVEELQIALLECAMEYEVKIVEMKMKMLHMKSEHRQKEGDNVQSKPGSEKSGEEMELFSINSHQEKTDGQRVEYLRKQLCRLQREKLAVTRELNDLKKRERQFDLQRRSLDDALGRVNSLQRELGKKEQEIVDCQLREKEVRAQFYEVQLALHKAQAAQIEPRKLLSLLPALREWLQTIKTVPCQPTVFEPQEKSTPRTPPVDSIVCSVTKEIQALQKALAKLASKK